MKSLVYICIFIGLITDAYSQKNLDFERWDINSYAVDIAKNWINTSDAAKYGAPKTLFKEVETPSKGMASAKLITTYWEGGAAYNLDTLSGALLQKFNYTKRPKNFQFDYKAFPKNGDEVLIGIQLTSSINDSLIVIGEGYFSSKTTQEEWKRKIIDIYYFSNLKPKTINIIAVSSANATVLDGSLGYAQIGSELHLDNLKLSTEVDKPKRLNYAINVFPNPAKEFITINSDSPNEQIIQIYSLTGKLLVENLFTATHKIDISYLTAGTYIYRVIDIRNNHVIVSNKFNIIK